MTSQPNNLSRVAIVGSGGLWHTPGNPESYLNEEFDHECIEFVKAGDVKGFADHFDQYLDAPADDYKDGKGVDGGAGRYNGLGGGTGGQRNWVLAGARGGGRPGFRAGERTDDVWTSFSSVLGAQHEMPTPSIERARAGSQKGVLTWKR